MRKLQKPLSIFSALFLLVYSFTPYLSVVPAVASTSADQLESKVEYNKDANTFKLSVNTDQKVEYIFAYKTDKQVEAVTGTREAKDGENFSRDVFAGTCSSDETCIGHKVIRGIFKVKVADQNWLDVKRFTLDQGNLNFVENLDKPTQVDLTDTEKAWLEDGTDLSPPTPTPTEAATPTPQGEILDGISTSITPTEAPKQDENGTLSATVLPNTKADSLDLDAQDPVNSASLATDKADYAPTDTVLITGTSFNPGETYTLNISSSDSPVVNFETQVTADENGSFSYAYQLDGNYRPNYQIQAKDQSGNIVATVTFTDSFKINLCHATGSQSNPYSKVQVNINSVNDCNNAGGHDGHSDDIIPSYTYSSCTYPGKNLSTIISGATGQEILNNNCNIPTGLIAGYKFNDLDGNGNKDSGENGLNGWVIFLDSNNNGVLDSGEQHYTTQYYWSNPGHYIFNNLPYGTYRVCEVMQSGWYNTSNPGGNNCHSLTTVNSSNPDYYHLDFGNKQGSQTGTIKIVKSTTPLSGDGTFDFTISGPTSSSPSITTSSNTGSYGPTTVNTGNYSITETLPTGWYLNSSYCSDGTTTYQTNNITVGSEKNVVCYFTDAKYGSINVTKVANPGDTGDEFNIILGGNKSSSQLVKNGDIASFTGLEPGHYNLGEVYPAGNETKGWYLDHAVCNGQNYDSGSDIYLQPAENVNCTFYNTEQGKIELKKHWVGTASGVYINIGTSQEASDIYSDWIDGSDGASGKQTVNPNNYYVSETLSLSDVDLYTKTLSCYNDLNHNDVEDAGDTTHSVNTSTGEVSVGAGEDVICTFTNTKIPQNGSVSGMKFLDLNRNGAKDSGETGVPGWWISLLHEDNSFYAQMQTDTNGQYSFTNVLPGTYKVCEEHVSNWDQTYPTGDTFCPIGKGHEITISDGDAITDKDFGNYEYGIARVIKKMVGGTDTFTFTGDLAGDITYDSGYINKTGLLPGTYTSTETAKPGWAITSITCDDANSTGDVNTGTINFHIEDGEFVKCTITNTKLATIHVVKNVVAPDGVTDVSDNYGFDVELNGADKKTLSENTPVDYSAVPGMSYTVSEHYYSYQPYTQLGCALASGAPATEFSVNPGENITVTCTNQQQNGTITGYKWNDLNGDGKRCLGEDCEPFLPDWTINLYANADGEQGSLIDTAITDQDGNYSFTVAPRNYWVCEAQQNGWLETTGGCYNVDFPSGATVEDINFGNHAIIPSLTISKSNNAGGDKLPGDVVGFTITITNDAEAGTAGNVKVLDLLPKGFHYNGGSYHAVLNNSTTLAISEPTYASPGTWTLPDMAPGDSITLTYSATIDSAQESGTYYDNALGQGTPVSDPANVILASAVAPGTIGDPNFVGTEVSVVGGQNTAASVSLDTTKEETTTGEVLGASTGLPATGENTIWVVIASVLAALGGLLVALGLALRKGFKLSSLKFVLRVTVLMLAVFMLAVKVNAVVDNVSIRISQPKTPTNLSPFNITFVALHTDDSSSLTVKCFKKGPGDAGFSQFGSNIVLNPNSGNTGNCVVDSSVLTTTGTYSFYASANGTDSSAVSVDWNNSTGPGTPTGYSKNKIDDCTYQIKFRTADDSGKTVRAEVYRSINNSFPLDNGTRVANLNVGSGTDVSLNNVVQECNVENFYAVRAFDAFGNGSGVVGDSGIIVTYTSTGATTTTTTTAGGQVAGGALTVAGAGIPAEQTQVLGTESAQPSGKPQEIQKPGETLGAAIAEKGLLGAFVDYLKNPYISIPLVILVLVLIYVFKKKSNKKSF